MRRTLTSLQAGAVAAALGVGWLVAAPAVFASAPRAASSLPNDVQRVCPVSTAPGVMSCLALRRTNVAAKSQARLGPDVAPVGFGYGSADLHSAYKLPSGTSGSGQTVAVVDAFDDPNAAADLATYRSAWGLPACTTASGCFRRVNQNGQASPLPAASGSTGWATEESLDLDMVSAACPNCTIILVEANSPQAADLGTGVNAAVSLGAKYVSNSYGGNEDPSETSADSAFYNHPGVAVTASAGDSGFGVSFPAASPHVVAVGGTSLFTASNSRGWSESAWSGTGSGCSAFEAKPSWQHDPGCGRRAGNDVAAVADPNTGVAVYDTYDQGGWGEFGGTSASSPIIAGVYALAGVPAAGSYPGSYPYAHTASLNDVTSGANGSCGPAYLCTAETRYDRPTGLGTPAGTVAFSSKSSAVTGTIVSHISAAKCVDDRSNSGANGTVVEIWSCNGGAAQNWTVEPNETVQIHGKCLDIAGKAVNGTKVDLWQCGTGKANQVWQPLSNGELINPWSGRCLDDPGSNLTNGIQLDIWACHGGRNQAWRIP